MTHTQQGRQLAKLSGNGYNISYQYDDSGIRTQKTVNGVTTSYVLDGSNVVFEQTGSDKIWYDYAADSTLIGFELNGTPYYYTYNLQGDITAVVDADGALVAKYAYDAWGNIISTTDGSGADISGNTSAVGYKNPYRYRGYRYDAETKLYYLQSRYYNPELGRFINSDALVDTGNGVLGSNMFTYCDNNPVMKVDEDGLRPIISLTRPSRYTLRLYISDTLKNIATYLMGCATIDGICAAILGFFPDPYTKGVAIFCTVRAAALGFAVYLLDKYGGSKRAYISVTVRFVWTTKISLVWRGRRLRVRATRRYYIGSIRTKWGLFNEI